MTKHLRSFYLMCLLFTLSYTASANQYTVAEVVSEVVVSEYKDAEQGKNAEYESIFQSIKYLNTPVNRGVDYIHTDRLVDLLARSVLIQPPQLRA